ncbi:MAG: GDP-mannose dehydrogenase [Verrucomicrobia bacterium]|nr:MAG: GDP-mannose dehydrogenase [Verrucomicrobiota bacterium]
MLMTGFIGLSHLGIVYSLATAARGFEVIGFDPDAALCDQLSNGRFPVAEPGLTDLFQSNRSRVRFSSRAVELNECDPVFVSLDVSTDQSNRSDLAPLNRLIDSVAGDISPTATVAILCQVPPGFTRSLKTVLDRRGVKWAGNLFYQVETLVFGNAVERALRPERFIIGCANPRAPLPGSYAGWLNAFGCPLLPMRYESAELAKIAINLFLVSTVSTTNTLAELCEKIGADWSEIAPALRLDKRIGAHAYLSPGLGIAGGNLERDLVTVKKLADERGTEAGVVEAWLLNSRYRRDWALRKVHELVLSAKENPALAIWGLAYKPDTNSLKNSPSLALIEALAPFAKVAYDPQARPNPSSGSRLQLAGSALEACQGADGLIVMTPWKEFSGIDPAKIKAAMKGNVLVDPFGALNQAACVQAGFAYHKLGVSV